MNDQTLYAREGSDQASLYARMMPGITLVLIITAAAYGIRALPLVSALSPMIGAIVVGILFANITTVPSNATLGISLVGKRMLRIAVALLGLQLTLSQVFEIGLAGMLGLAILVAGTYAATLLLARVMGVERPLARLIAAGTSICGASAVAAASAVDKTGDDDVAYAVACVTLFGTISMIVYPLLGSFLDLNPRAYAFWTGASIHEVAQVVAAGFQFGDASGEFSVVVKLSRVLLLAPLLIVVGVLLARRNHTSGPSIKLTQAVPPFVAAFILLMLLNSAGVVPDTVRAGISQLTPVILTAALAALGLGTRFASLQAKGMRPMLLAAFATVVIALGGLAVASVLG